MKAEEIEGKWFRWDTRQTFEFPRVKYVKGGFINHKSDGLKLFYTEYINDNGEFFPLEDWLEYDEEIIPISLEEIQPYLPENHPDKFKTMKKLPKYFVIKRNANNPLWDKYINWLNETYNQEWIGCCDFFYGFVGCSKYNGIDCREVLSGFVNTPTVLTLEEWDSIINKQENNNNMERKIRGAFCIKDFPNNRFGVHSKEYMGVDFIYNSESWKDYNPTKYPEYWKIVYEEEFKVGDWISFYSELDNCVYTSTIKEWTSSSYCKLNNGLEPFKNLIRKATPEEIKNSQQKELYFGDVKFTIKKGNDYAETAYGKVTKEEIKKAIDYIENPPRLAGKYELTIHVNGIHSCLRSPLIDSFKIGFGCKSGKLSELKAIYQAFE